MEVIIINFILLKRKKAYLNFLILLSFILLSFISIALLLNYNTTHLGYDLQFNFRRIMELKDSIMNGNYFSSFSFNEFHGSSVMSLYPYLNLLPAALLSFVIKSKITLLYIFTAFNMLLNFIISFYSSKNYTKRYDTSYVFAIVYGMSNVFIFYSIITNDLGVASSYIPIPLIIFGFMKIINGKNSWIQLSLGISLLLYSHILNFIIIIIFLFTLLMINIKKVNKNIIINFIKSLLLCIVITSIIWLPFLYLYLNNLNHINMPAPRILEQINIKDFFSGLYGSKKSDSIGFFPLISIFISLFFYKRFNRYIKQLYILSLIIIFSVLFFPWKLLTSYRAFQFLRQFQMTERFLIIPLMLLSFIFALIVSKYINIKYNKKIILYVFIIFVTITLQLITGQYATIKNISHSPSISNHLTTNDIDKNIAPFFNYKINNSNQFNSVLSNYYLSDDDYIPKKSLKISSYVNKNLGFYNNKHQINIQHNGYNKFSFKGKNNIKNISLPIYLYNHEKINVYLNNHPVKYFANNHNMLTIPKIQNLIYKNNNIYIKSSSNIIKIVSIILSLLGWLFIIILFIKKIYLNIHYIILFN